MRKKKPAKTPPLFVHTTPKFKARLKAVTDLIEKGMSEFTRDAVNGRIEELAKGNAAIAQRLNEIERQFAA